MTQGIDLTSEQERVSVQLREMLPKLMMGRFVELNPTRYVCPRGSTHVDVRLMQFGDQVAVRSLSPVTVDSRLDEELYRFLLNRNAGFLFGAFGIEAWRSHTVIVFTHTILATSLDAHELGASVHNVLSVADRYDDEIVARWGGRTMQEVGTAEIIPRRVLALMRSGDS